MKQTTTQSIGQYWKEHKHIGCYIKQHRRALFCTGALLFAALLLNFLARNTEGFAPWYALHVFPILPSTLGRLLSPLPFSLFEGMVVLGVILAAVFAAAVLLFLLLLIAKALGSVLKGLAGHSTKNRRPVPFLSSPGGRLGRFLGHSVPALICVLASLFFMQTLTCLINYDRTDFTAEAGLITYPATDENLTELCSLLIADLNQLISAPESPKSSLTFNEEGGLSLKGTDVAVEAKAAMTKLGGQYDSLSGYYPNPKPIFFSRAMSSLSLTGIFGPFTTEPNYNRDVTPYVIPYTICHELAHAKGHIKENEAGFIAYLACAGADSPQLRYSGALNALSYSLGALYRSVTEEEYFTVLKTVPQQALTDLQINQAYWQQFHQGARGVISSTARAANDHYLKANAQSDGSKSYGRMVDLLLAYYKIGAQEL